MFAHRFHTMDRGTMNKVIREMEHLSRISAVPLLHRSHPYLPDITRDTSDHLKLILAKGSLTDHRQHEYLHVTVHSILRKAAHCNEILGFNWVPQGAESVARRNLTKLSLIFSHILAELKALFPGGKFQGNTYKISKPEASQFWTNTFGQRCLVQWSEFRAGLNLVHPVGSGPLESALHSTVDLTCNDYVSVFEFDIFTRLFQPWNTLLQNWMLLAVTHPGYMAFLTYDEVREHLKSHIQKPGSYIFRLSCTHLGQWAIGYVTSKRDIVQTIPHDKPLYVALLEGEKEGLYLHPNGVSNNPDLSELSNPSAGPKVQVSQEQWDLYSQMGSSFELCKICVDNEKNVRIKPCGHLLCNDCLLAWQKSDGHTCPFCRCEIHGKEEVHVLSQPEAEEITASSDASSSLTFDLTKEEEEWIRQRPLPPTPVSGSSSVASAPSMPSTPPLPLSHSPTPFGLQVVPTLTHRLQLQANDVIFGRTEASGGTLNRTPPLPPRIRWDRHRGKPPFHST
ncbi:E3 ubiquitin-protein ligase CBL-like isoform X2 [Xenopus laevis]|uniref:E3 ubiquitin-protein ligase CBL n=2 Tax=Xenopus laevis TaxID=8355 RepID=A0A1L8FN82_XENLA|nr:E3 ubiquitin-protein ligase CBL-like isoform X2 [Xenopus laevis]OCT73040.1 hypothetical protein XELAEV_18036019mg [Xenopus laevis]